MAVSDFACMEYLSRSGITACSPHRVTKFARPSFQRPAILYLIGKPCRFYESKQRVSVERDHFPLFYLYKLRPRHQDSDEAQAYHFKYWSLVTVR